MTKLTTTRLQLVPATLELCRAELDGRNEVARVLHARIPPSWPPPVFEPDDLDRLRRSLEAEPETGGWTLHYVLVKEKLGRRVLVGVAGYVGPPSAEGAVEIGYAIAEEHQRRGYATEAVEALVVNAFDDARVDLVAATTYATLTPSIGVLTKAGFSQVGTDAETGLVRFERRRAPLGVRPAVPGDVAAMAALSAQLGYVVPDETFADRLARLLERADQVVVVAGEGKAPVLGWIHAAEQEFLEAPRRCEILGLIVDRTARRRGIGQQLVMTVERWAAGRGLSEMSVRSNLVRAESHPFYARLGYDRTKTQHVYRKRL